jgi:hypothetical protein
LLQKNKKEPDSSFLKKKTREPYSLKKQKEFDSSLHAAKNTNKGGEPLSFYKKKDETNKQVQLVK